MIRNNSRRRLFSLLAISSAALVGSMMTGLPAMAAGTGPTISDYTVQTNNNDVLVAINGQNFGTTDAGATVTFGNISAPIDSWSNTSIQVTLPQNAGPGPLLVTTSLGSSNTISFAGVQRGYYTLAANGTVTVTGDVQFYGDLATINASTASPAIELVPTPDYQGYWILTQNGQIYAFGNATAFTPPNTTLTAVGMAVTPSGQGAFLLSNNGQVYPIGNAANYGNAPSGIVATSIASTPSGLGYWILGANGTVYAFGDAVNYGNQPESGDAPPTIYPNGSLLRITGTSAVYYLNNGTLHHIPDAPLFLTMGFSWSQVQVVASLANYTLGAPMVTPFPSGTLIKPAGQNAVYLVMQGVLRHVGSPAVLYAMGYNFSEVTLVPNINANWPMGPELASAVPYEPNGTLLRQQNSPTVYVAVNDQLCPIQSASVFLGMGYQWSQIQLVANLPGLPFGPEVTSPNRVYPTGTLVQLNGTAPVYLVQNNVLRHIDSPAILYALGYNFSEVTHVTTLGNLPIGSDVGSTQLPSQPPMSTAVALYPTADGQGYWILSSNGQVNNFGDAANLGGPNASQMGNQTAVGLAMTPDLQGYDILTSDGQTLAFGDATLNSATTNATSLVISPEPAGKLLSMGYGFFTDPPVNGDQNSAYEDLLQNGSQLSVIQPAWFYVNQNADGSWSVDMWASASNVSSVTNAAHQQNVLIMPSIGSYYNPANGPITTTQEVQSMVSQIVNLVTQNNWDGITIDFENSSAYHQSGMTESQASQQYTNFVMALGQALHAINKKLMVAVYPSPYPNTIYNYSAIAPYVDWINIMTYPEHNSSTWPGPTAGYPWVQNLISQALATGVNPQQLIMGVAPYGHYWVVNNQGINAGLPNPPGYQTNRSVQAFIQSNNITPLWDPVEKEITFTSGPLDVAPTESLSTNNVGTYDPQVQNLQDLLNYILLRYAVTNGETPPAMLTTDGFYGPATANAVAAFQQDFNVVGDPAGVYGAATQAALQQVIQNWQIGQDMWWDETSRSFKDRLELAIQEGLGGVASWRMPFETQGYWTALATETTVTHFPTEANTQGNEVQP